MTVLDHAQRSEAWYDARKGLPTCSRFDAILTPKEGKPSKGQDKLMNELIAESLLPPQEGFIRGPMTPEMEHGICLEAEARCAYELEFAKEPVREVGFIIAEGGLYGGSPDALVGDNGGVEIKCPNLSTHIGYVRAGILPTEYKCQVHGYMVVTGRAWWDFFSYTRNVPPFLIRVHRDGFTESLANALADFCAEYNRVRSSFNLSPIGQQTA